MSSASSPRRRTSRRAAALVITFTLAVSGCGSNGTDEAGGSPAAAPSERTPPADADDGNTSTGAPPVVAELCRAQAQPAEAEERFANVHGPLHELADEVQQDDRPAAAALLEAKRAVEDTLAESEADHDKLADRLAPLVDAVRDALATLDRPAPPCDADLSSR